MKFFLLFCCCFLSGLNAYMIKINGTTYEGNSKEQVLAILQYNGIEIPMEAFRDEPTTTTTTTTTIKPVKNSNENEYGGNRNGIKNNNHYTFNIYYNMAAPALPQPPQQQPEQPLPANVVEKDGSRGSNCTCNPSSVKNKLQQSTIFPEILLLLIALAIVSCAAAGVTSFIAYTRKRNLEKFNKKMQEHEEMELELESDDDSTYKLAMPE